jgi:hypothetical protein
MSEKSKTEKKSVERPIIEDIQKQLDAAKDSKNKIVDKKKDEVLAKIATVRDFQEYYRPYQEGRTLMWNELGALNAYDLPINVNAGRPDVPAVFSNHLTLYYTDPSREQVDLCDTLRGKYQDMDRQERTANTLPINEIKKMGLTIPVNYFTISSDSAKAKKELTLQRIIMFCGVSKDTAGHIATVAHSTSLDDILDSWEYRVRTGYPNSKAVQGGSENTSSSAFQ